MEISMTTHNQVKVIHPREGVIEVDAGIAALLEALWAIDVDTSMSCQGVEGDRIWIEFPSNADAERFLALVANHLDPSSNKAHLTHAVYRRMTQPLETDAWDYYTFPLDVTELFEPHEQVNGGAAEFMVTTSVHFPRDDYGDVLRAAEIAAAHIASRA
jgi:hypothetical protein